ncbi:MAG: hypothetical protein OD918_12095 [Gammaproteobacteria bacterium]
MPSNVDGDKRVIGLYGEMVLAMELHARGWQVYRAYIDEQVDFIVARYYCQHCKCFSGLEKRVKGTGSFPTDLCEKCKTKSLCFVFRLIQVKASEGIPVDKPNGERKFSFHAKLRSNVDDRSFYAWIALFKQGSKARPKPHFFIFNHKDIARFDNLDLPSYQETDNQKITLRVLPDGTVMNRSRPNYDYDYGAFNKEFLDGFSKLEEILPIDTTKK